MSNKAALFERIVHKFMEISERRQVDAYLQLSDKADSDTRHKLLTRNTEKDFAILQYKWLIAASHAFADAIDGIERRLERIERGKEEVV